MSRTLDEDDLELPQRPSRPEAREPITRETSHDADREFTLSTGTVLALFLALALICAVFFGFGYSIGHKSAQASEAARVAVADTDTQPGPVANKPAAGAPVTAPIPGYQGDAAAGGKLSAPVVPKAVTSADGTKVTIATPGTTGKPARPVTGVPADSGGVPVERPAPQASGTAATPPLASSGDPAAVYVQIAAVSHQEDANVLLTALKRRGYSVFTRSGEGDKLIHVQVGPYSGKKDAEVMRQRLLGDGYNAILK